MGWQGTGSGRGGRAMQTGLGCLSVVLQGTGRSRRGRGRVRGRSKGRGKGRGKRVAPQVNLAAVVALSLTPSTSSHASSSSSIKARVCCHGCLVIIAQLCFHAQKSDGLPQDDSSLLGHVALLHTSDRQVTGKPLPGLPPEGVFVSELPSPLPLPRQASLRYLRCAYFGPPLRTYLR